MKTVYSEKKKEYNIRESSWTVYSHFSTKNAMEYVENPFAIKLYEGEKLLVIFDDKEYECTAYKDGDYVHIGNSAMLRGIADANEPFDVYVTVNDVFAGAMDAGFHKITIRRMTQSELPEYIVTVDDIIKSFNDVFGEIVNGKDFVYVFKHEKDGTKHILSRDYNPLEDMGDGIDVAFKATADYKAGDTFVVCGREFTAKYNGTETNLADEYFKAGENVGIAKLTADGYIIFNDAESLKDVTRVHL